MNSLDKIMSTGARSAFPKEAQPGATVTGTITGAIERQCLDFDSKKPEFWDDGSPKMQIVISVQTQERVDAEDDGVRSVYVKGWGAQKIALANAIRDAGFTLASEALAPGNVFTAQFTGYGENKRGGFPPKEFRYQIQRGAQVGQAFNQPPAHQPVQQAVPANPWATAPTADANPFGAPQPTPPTQSVPAPFAAPQPVQPAPTPQPQYQPSVQTPVGPVNPTTGEVLTPPAAPATPAAPAENPAVALIRQGADDATIQAQTGLTPDVIAIMRQQLAG